MEELAEESNVIGKMIRRLQSTLGPYRPEARDEDGPSTKDGPRTKDGRRTKN